MYYYFTSSTPSALKINGIYLGVIENTVKHINIECENPFIEVLPLSSECVPTSFILTNEFLSCPPKNVSVTDMKGGYVVCFTHSQNSAELKVIEQKKFPQCVVTVFSDGNYKISVETASDFYSENLLTCVESAEIEIFNNFIAVGLRGKTTSLYVFNLNGKIQRELARPCSNFTFSDGLITQETFTDIAKHNLKIIWDCSGNSLRISRKELTRCENFSVSRLPTKILPFAFLEELLVGGDVSPYIADNIKQNADKLAGYLGNFVGVMPPPFFRSPEEVGIILPSGKNLYTVNYLTFEIQDRLITNIKKV